MVDLDAKCVQSACKECLIDLGTEHIQNVKYLEMSGALPGLCVGCSSVYREKTERARLAVLASAPKPAPAKRGAKP